MGTNFTNQIRNSLPPGCYVLKQRASARLAPVRLGIPSPADPSAVAVAAHDSPFHPWMMCASTWRLLRKWPRMNTNFTNKIRNSLPAGLLRPQTPRFSAVGSCRTGESSQPPPHAPEFTSPDLTYKRPPKGASKRHGALTDISAPPVRLELTTNGLEVRCAIHLRYGGRPFHSGKTGRKPLLTGRPESTRKICVSG